MIGLGRCRNRADSRAGSRPHRPAPDFSDPTLPRLIANVNGWHRLGTANTRHGGQNLCCERRCQCGLRVGLEKYQGKSRHSIVGSRPGCERGSRNRCSRITWPFRLTGQPSRSYGRTGIARSYPETERTGLSPRLRPRLETAGTKADNARPMIAPSQLGVGRRHEFSRHLYRATRFLTTYVSRELDLFFFALVQWLEPSSGLNLAGQQGSDDGGPPATTTQKAHRQDHGRALGCAGGCT